ncbi:MAG: cytochrome P450 [Chitinophagales bacterium]
MSITTFKELKHIPGEAGLPVFGDFFAFVSNASKYYKAKQTKYGDVFRSKTLFGASVILCGPAANKFLLVEEGKFTSNKQAWEQVLSDLFPNGLMLMDGERHKSHRSIMQEAFKKDPMQGYLEIMPEIISNGLDELKGKEKVLFFPFFKNLTLKLAARVFFGLELNKDLKLINKALTNLVDAATSLPINVPFSGYRKGLNGRAFLVDYFKSILPERRSNPGKDLFSRLCEAKNEEGEQFTDQEIIDHLIFVLMAAHDTTAITLTFMSYFLAKNPKWQTMVREESGIIDLFGELYVKDLRQLEKTGLVMKETLRIHPPLITVTRKTEKELEVEGYKIPKDTFVNAVFQVTHHDERTWTSPENFDPERFNSKRKEQLKCPFSYAPFGAGKHHCIGFAFAEMQIKLVITELLKRHQITVPEDYECPVRDVPLKQPKDGLPIFLKEV